jgi:hypothetical protein
MRTANAEEDDDGRLEAVAIVLERLALEIRATVKRQATTSVEEKVNERRGEPIRSAWRKGDRVRVTIRDRYYGQIGTLLGRHGRLYWDLKLDARDGECARVIYKKESSLSLVADN